MAIPVNVEQYIEKHPKWQNELKRLRKLMQSFPFEETIKWGGPVYTFKGKNLIGLAAFKNHFGLWFFHGSDLQNNTKLFQMAKEGKTKNMRQIKYVEGENPDYDILKEYIKESIELAKEGKLINRRDETLVIIPPEFENLFKKHNDLEINFKNLSPGKQKEYILYVTEAKREETKEGRIDKIIPLIAKGKGLNDKYKK